METTQSFNTTMDRLVDEIAQYDPRLFQELHYDRQAVKHALKSVLCVVATYGILAEPEADWRVPDEPEDDAAHQTLNTPDSCIWMP